MVYRVVGGYILKVKNSEFWGISVSSDMGNGKNYIELPVIMQSDDTTLKNILVENKIMCL